MLSSMKDTSSFVKPIFHRVRIDEFLIRDVLWNDQRNISQIAVVQLI
jgi:hypothetical protein